MLLKLLKPLQNYLAMKNLIKILLALFIVLCSYFIGYYQAKENYSIQLNEVKVQLSSNQSRIEHLKDSINKISTFFEHRRDSTTKLGDK